MVARHIEQQLRQAVAQTLPDADPSQVKIRPCPNPKFGDYQSTSIMALAKPRKLNPRKLAEQTAQRLDASPWCEEVAVAGPGFINFRLRPEAAAEAVRRAALEQPPFLRPADRPRTIVLDFSS
ncbi:MAG: arginine--tRNA ligase, partial [Verrucomicrobia bacterium]|nr:arginine--tRNA ligase [Verrucomicrobiota bacterium]